MTTSVVTDEQLGQLARRQHDLFRRVREGTLPVARIIEGLQCLIEGRPLDTRIVDLDAAPFIPKGWKLESHKKGGQFAWDSAQVTLHLEAGQQGGNAMKGTDLQKALEDKPVLNANALDFLLAHPELIPESWKDKYVFFWGTVYRFSDGCLCVRYLRWDGAGWGWRAYWFECGWRGQDPAAVLASI